ncbi:MAG: hypothetical protein ABI673_00590 [Novosphingobium sp.]
MAAALVSGCHKADDYDSRYDQLEHDIEARQRAIESDIASQGPTDPEPAPQGSVAPPR